MRVFDKDGKFRRFLPSFGMLETSTLRKRLLAFLVPSALIIFVLAGYATYRVHMEFITLALERYSRLNVATTAHAIEQFFSSCRRDLVLAARQPLSAEDMRRHLENLHQTGEAGYIEFGYITKGAGEHIVFVVSEDNIVQLPDAKIRDIRPSPALYYGNVNHLDRDEVWLSPLTEVEYPFPTESNVNNRIALKVYRLVTPYYSQYNDRLGYLYIGVDGRMVRNILSVHNSDQSPVFVFPRNPTLQRYFYFFDKEGWILFESYAVSEPHAELSTLDVRVAKQGTMGRPGLPSAFRPVAEESRYWAMLEDVRNGSKGLMREKGDTVESPLVREFLAYSPVRLFPSSDKSPEVVGGVAYVDRSRLTEVAGYRHLEVMVIIVLLAGAALALIIILVASTTTRPLLEMARSLKELRSEGQFREIHLAKGGYEVQIMQNAINDMIGTIKDQLKEIRLRDKAIESVALKEPAVMTEPPLPKGETEELFPEFIGSGQLMEQLKGDIVKAAQVDVDVLIVGETGTGKQLAAEAIHRLSRRFGRPFTSINCGELDENLLLDSLFGHVKGAFTDGKGERKGAFLEADGGTLFLDEIQSASSRVQQALLRAVAMRKVKPLGSDKEVDVDVRLVTATNADLKGLIEAGKFREDLYYRLRVITINTPALREHRENIPFLANHYLKEAEKMAGREGLSISRGALDKLMGYHWPGNIRELKNVIITAGVMAEGRVIQAEQLNVEWVEKVDVSTAFQPHGMPPFSSTYAGPFDVEDAGSNGGEKFDSVPDPASVLTDLPSDLNPRQLAAWVHVLKNGEITRKDYQNLLGNSISKRTASYDIEDLIHRGLLVKVGRGPLTRYIRPSQE